MLNFVFTLGVALFLNFLLYWCWFSNIWQRKLGFLNPPNFYHRIGGSEAWVLSTSSLLPFFPCSKTFFLLLFPLYLPCWRTHLFFLIFSKLFPLWIEYISNLMFCCWNFVKKGRIEIGRAFFYFIKVARAIRLKWKGYAWYKFYATNMVGCLAQAAFASKYYLEAIFVFENVKF